MLRLVSPRSNWLSLINWMKDPKVRRKDADDRLNSEQCITEPASFIYLLRSRMNIKSQVSQETRMDRSWDPKSFNWEALHSCEYVRSFLFVLFVFVFVFVLFCSKNLWCAFTSFFFKKKGLTEVLTMYFKKKRKNHCSSGCRRNNLREGLQPIFHVCLCLSRKVISSSLVLFLHRDENNSVDWNQDCKYMLPCTGMREKQFFTFGLSVVATASLKSSR